MFLISSCLATEHFFPCNAVVAAAAALLKLGFSLMQTFRHGLYGQLVGSVSRAL